MEHTKQTLVQEGARLPAVRSWALAVRTCQANPCARRGEAASNGVEGACGMEHTKQTLVQEGTRLPAVRSRAHAALCKLCRRWCKAGLSRTSSVWRSAVH